MGKFKTGARTNVTLRDDSPKRVPSSSHTPKFMRISYEIQREDIISIEKPTRYERNICEFSLLHGGLRIICQEDAIDTGVPDQSK